MLLCTINPGNEILGPGYKKKKAAVNPWTHCWKIKPSKRRLWIPSLTKERDGNRKDLIMLFTPSPLRLEKQDVLQSHMIKCVIWMLRYTMLSWLETAAAPAGGTDWITGTRPVWSSKGMRRDWWVWQPNTVNYRKVLCVFRRNVSPVPLAGLVQNMFLSNLWLKY